MMMSLRSATAAASATCGSSVEAGGPGRIALGLRAIRGGGVVVGVGLDGREPGIIFSTFLPTSVVDDRLSLEPYRVAYDLPRGPDGGPSPDAAAAVAEGRKRQCEAATQGLRHILRNAGCAPTTAALLVNRTGWITDALSYSLSWPEHVPIAEGLAVRDALRFACHECGIAVIETDEKSLHEAASQQLGLSAEAIDLRLKSLGTMVGKPWRKEQKLACLAAWAAVSAS